MPKTYQVQINYCPEYSVKFRIQFKVFELISINFLHDPIERCSSLEIQRKLTIQRTMDRSLFAVDFLSFYNESNGFFKL